MYVTRIRVAESNKDIYDELSASGRWTTQGILFESGKSDLKPESTPTLKAIAAALKGHPDLKVEIQGHTDNVGSAASNITLSQARADAVKAALVADYAIAEDQLSAKGYGDTKPVGEERDAGRPREQPPRRDREALTAARRCAWCVASARGASCLLPWPSAVSGLSPPTSPTPSARALLQVQVQRAQLVVA